MTLLKWKFRHVGTILALLFLLVSTASRADQFGDFTFVTNGPSITITKYTGQGGTVVIPNMIKGLPVTCIGYYAFDGCSSLTSVTIPGSVTNIGNSAFSACTSLSSVTIPNNVVSIGDCALYYCTNLTNISVEAANPRYSSVAGVLFNKYQTTLIQWPSGRVGSYSIPNSVTSIGDYAFSDCSLTNAVIPNSVSSIGDYAFNRCSGLTSLTIPSSVTSIGNWAFFLCTNLTNAVIPSGVINIGDYAFNRCSGLTSLIFPNSITSIGDSAFSWCTSLSSVTIPSSVTNIGDFEFCVCTNLTNISVEAANPRYSSVAGVLFNKYQTTLIQWPSGRLGNYTIPTSVISIGDYAFSWCSGLSSVTISSSVANIGGSAFYNCSGLTTVAIPSSVTTIGDAAFSGCTSLTNVVISTNATSIGDYAFNRCSGLTSLTIPNSITNLGNSAFSWCSGLSSVTIPSSVTKVGDYEFCACTSLTNVVIPNSITSIGEYAFYGCSSLISVYFQGNAPSLIDAGHVFYNDFRATIYFLAGTTGWGSTFFGGLPTKLYAGSLMGTLSPSEAVAAGATWSVDGGLWQSSGIVISNLAVGTHTVTFSPIAGWATPSNQVVTVTFNQTTAVQGIYVGPYTATAIGITVNGFLVSITLTDPGYGYSDAPTVYIVGGGGSGAQASATVSNGVITAIRIINPGSGYTSTPTIVIGSPDPRRLGISEVSRLTFTNLVLSHSYQCQEFQGGNWSNFGTNFVANASSFSQYVDASASPSSYRLVSLPLPQGATATAELAYGFFVGALVANHGSGYSAAPIVTISGGGGSGAQATATVSNGIVVAINVIGTGSGYTSLPDVQIDPPSIQPLSPAVAKAVRIDCSGLAPNLTYQIQASQNFEIWTNYGTTFTTMAATNSLYLNLEGGNRYFRVSYLP